MPQKFLAIAYFSHRLLSHFSPRRQRRPADDFDYAERRLA